ncbi:Catenin alpha-2 [Liparis tanakae]|uniref:Catenin alpha-2 n=1 Tax=Liparis tanakae TaxID=230148 RepID=A0A4Z2EA25_9TELE|nr:Catenin alpha-2 [Liparis tanakae]
MSTRQHDNKTTCQQDKAVTGSAAHGEVTGRLVARQQSNSLSQWSDVFPNVSAGDSFPVSCSLFPVSCFLGQTGRKEKGDPLNSAIDKMTKKTRDLRRQLRKAVMDHISDSFLETNVPLLVLIEAAKSGNEKEVKEYAQVFREHANKLVEVSRALV